MNLRSCSALVALVIVAVMAACAPAAPPTREYQLTGQILAVNADKLELTIKHADIPNFMPAMTMTYGVAHKDLLVGRVAGETITGTLQVVESTGVLTAITHTGSAPLPGANEVAMASGALAEGDTVPDTAFIDEHDARRSFSEWKGTTTLVTFIYTRCPLPDFCPLMNRHFATLQRAIVADPALKGRVKLVTITFDPEYDTPKVLADVAKREHADPAVWTFLTGDLVSVHRFAGRFGVGVIRPDGMVEINHNLRTALIGPDGTVRKFYSGNEWTPDTALADIRAVVSR